MRKLKDGKEKCIISNFVFFGVFPSLSMVDTKI